MYFPYQGFSNLAVHVSHLRSWLKCRFCLSRSEVGLKLCISNKLLVVMPLAHGPHFESPLLSHCKSEETLEEISIRSSCDRLRKRLFIAGKERVDQM